ncbi:MAG: GNAT family N-acetyltransferase [Elainellaceae cyanobacterium]
MTKQIYIQPADVAAAEPLAQLSERTFRAAFAKDNSPEDMEAYVSASFSLSRIQAELADEANRFLLAFALGGDVPCGYAKLRTGRTDPSVTGPDPIELERLYVDQSMIGCGVGATLMRASLNAARLAGYRTLWLGVWEHNERAIAFYQRWGFTTSGRYVFVLGSDRQTDFIMERPVEDSGS